MGDGQGRGRGGEHRSFVSSPHSEKRSRPDRAQYGHPPARTLHFGAALVLDNNEMRRRRGETRSGTGLNSPLSFGETQSRCQDHARSQRGGRPPCSDGVPEPIPDRSEYEGRYVRRETWEKRGVGRRDVVCKRILSVNRTSGRLEPEQRGIGTVNGPGREKESFQGPSVDTSTKRRVGDEEKGHFAICPSCPAPKDDEGSVRG